MSTILDLPEVHERVLRWSVEDYEALAEQLPKNVELIRGALIEKMPKSPLHWALSQQLRDLILGALPAGFLLRQEAPLRLADSEPEPDLAVVRGGVPDFAGHHPSTAALVIEIAVSSAAADRAYASLYAEAEVEEYWIVLARERAVEVYTAPVGGVYTERRVVNATETLLCSSVPNLAIPLREVFSLAE